MTLNRNYLPIVVFLCLVVTGCQKEENLYDRQVSTPKLLLPQTPGEVFSFLSAELPDQYIPEEIYRLQSMLQDPSFSDNKRSTTVEVPAGSVDAIQAAIDEAGEGGTVLIKSGTHTENGLITISHKVNLIGENGAEVILFTPFHNAPPVMMQKGIYFDGAAGSIVRNIDFKAGNNEAGYCVLIENSDQVQISSCSFDNFQFAIYVNYSDRVRIQDNRIIGDPSKIGAPLNHGIVIVNGKSPSLVSNTVSGFTFGIWACDRGGVSWANETYGNFYGQILCKVPAPALLNPKSMVIAAENSGNHWLLAFNNSHDNFYGGIVAIDGAFKNVLLANKAQGNGAYDIDLAGDTERFGFFTPTSFQNRVWSAAGILIKDCGEDNKVVGGDHVDTTEDPCDNVMEEG